MAKGDKAAVPPFKSVQVEEELVDTLHTEAQELDMPFPEYVHRKLSTTDGGRVSQSREIEAFILKRLDPEHVELLKECCKDTGFQPLDYILNYCHRMFEIGEGSFIEGEQKNFLEERTIGRDRKAKCDQCHKWYSIERPGQRYCGYDCGKAADLETMHAMRPRERDKDITSVTPPQKDFVAEMLQAGA